jgi:hypothetical protein
VELITSQPKENTSMLRIIRRDLGEYLDLGWRKYRRMKEVTP